jgi:hypothetical protein
VNKAHMDAILSSSFYCRLGRTQQMLLRTTRSDILRVGVPAAVVSRHRVGTDADKRFTVD